VRKAFVGPLAPRRPWRQVVRNYIRRQNVLRVKKVAQAAQRKVGCVKMSRKLQQQPIFLKQISCLF